MLTAMGAKLGPSVQGRSLIIFRTELHIGEPLDLLSFDLRLLSFFI